MTRDLLKGGANAMTGRPATIGVVGAGLSGLMCARTLSLQGHAVRVFEKSRGPGGRTSTRRQGLLRFDHGAQYFTVRDLRFRQLVESWRAVGLVAPWHGRIAVVSRGSSTDQNDGVERLVGVPGMNAVARHLTNGLRVTYASRVVEVLRQDGRWRLVADTGAELGTFDAVVVSAPAPQTAALLESAAPEVAASAASAPMSPCWAVMVAFDDPLDLPFDAAFVREGPLAWVARNSSKPSRGGGGDAWVLHANPQWSRCHIDDPPGAVETSLMHAFAEAVGEALPWPIHLAAHRWRFALPEDPLAMAAVTDPHRAIVACGDWCGGPRVEGAVLSGLAAADAVSSWISTAGQGSRHHDISNQAAAAMFQAD